MGSCPLESLSGLQEGPERCHGLCHTKGIRYLVDQAEPGAYICEVLGGREFRDRLDVFLARLDCRRGDDEAGKFDRIPCKLEFGGVEGNAVVATDV